ncbi:MAG: hypothetical protein ACSLFQ_02410 [Thermoanaerobaculia bacterium]
MKSTAYLPPGAAIRATKYPVIKPKPNSFVFEVDFDPAIFTYLDATVVALARPGTVSRPDSSPAGWIVSASRDAANDG